MILIRIGWFTLAALSGLLAIFAASTSMAEITDCELGLFPTSGIANWEQCRTSIAASYGNSIFVILALPMLVCLIPAVKPDRRTAWFAAIVLIIGSFGSWFVPTTHSTYPPQFVVYVYFVPVALAAVLLAAFHKMGSNRRYVSTAERRRVHQQTDRT